MLSKITRRAFEALALFVVMHATTPAWPVAEEIIWKNIGPGGGGTMDAAAVSPLDPDIVIMGSDVGGIYRSIDGGETWSLVNRILVRPDLDPRYGTSQIAFASGVSNDPNVVYIANRRSSDAGATWEIPPLVEDRSIRALAIDRFDAHLVYGATVAGTIYRSTDGWETDCKRYCLLDPGVEFPCDRTCSNQPAVGPEIEALVTHPGNSDQLLACTAEGLYRSDDGARSWTKLGPPGSPPPGLPHEDCVRAVVHPGGSVYATLRTHVADPDATDWVDIDSWQGGAYRSDDWGVSWTDINGYLDDENLLPNPDFEQAGDPGTSWFVVGAGTVTREETTGHAGTTTFALKMTNGGRVETSHMPIDSPDRSGTLQIISVWAKVTQSVSPPSAVRVRVSYYDSGDQPLEWPGASYNFIDAIANNDPEFDAAEHFGWRRFERLIRVPDGAAFIKVRLNQETTVGTTWFDDVSLRESRGVARRVGLFRDPATEHRYPAFVNYEEIVVDPTDGNVVYIGTTRGTTSDSRTGSDSSGIWKGVFNPDPLVNDWEWTHVTRMFYRDNAEDGRPVCGNDVCEARWEDCFTCAEDCAGRSPAGFCCGDNVCDKDPLLPGDPTASETEDNCMADCPIYTDPNRTFYEDDGMTFGSDFEVHSIAIGSGAAGHMTLYFGGAPYRSRDGGASWTEIRTVPHTIPVPQQTTGDASFRARGENTDTYAITVATDPARPTRIYYGDQDNRILISYDGGESFVYEGNPDWRQLSDALGIDGLSGSAATSILVDDAPPAGTDRIYVGSFANDLASSNWANYGAALQGDYEIAANRWSWGPLGNLNTFPRGGGVRLVRGGGVFYAASYGNGVYRLLSPPDGDWQEINSSCDPIGDPLPAGWKVHRLAGEASGKLYAAAGDPLAASLPPPGETGVWEWDAGGECWWRINDTGSDTGPGMDREPVIALLPIGPDTLFVGTYYARGAECASPCSGGWDGDGGLYRGTRVAGFGWTWEKVLNQPHVTGVVVTLTHDSIMYAQASQVNRNPPLSGQQAGIYKSVRRGAAGSWTLLDNSGPNYLKNLRRGQLFTSTHDPSKLYAATIGSGLFEGTITCADENGVCEPGEECNSCPNDCGSGIVAGCGNGVCEPGEDCLACPEDCNGTQKGKSSERFCCSGTPGGGGGDGPVDCADLRCDSAGFSCSDQIQPEVNYCCGDGSCDLGEDNGSCALDCAPFCGDGTRDVGEECDGSDFGNVTCADFGCGGGSLTCTPGCAIDASSCASCPECDNDGICEPGEDCFGCPADCAGQTGGPKKKRFCCGNGEQESEEGDGSICDGQY